MRFLKDKLGWGDDEAESVEDQMDFEDEFDDEEDWDEEFEEEEELEEEDTGPREWDSAYHFLDEALQAQGFAGVQEFMAKAMMHRVVNSAEFRDQIKHGAQSLQMVNQAMESIQGMEGDKQTDYGKMAQQLQEANQLVDEVEKMTDEEGQMVREGLMMVHEVLDAYKSSGGNGGSVNAGTKSRNESL